MYMDTLSGHKVDVGGGGLHIYIDMYMYMDTLSGHKVDVGGGGLHIYIDMYMYTDTKWTQGGCRGRRTTLLHSCL